MKPPHRDYECPACNEWIEILPTSQTDDFRCPWCNQQLRLETDAEFENGQWKDLSKLVTKGSHWDDKV